MHSSESMHVVDSVHALIEAARLAQQHFGVNAWFRGHARSHWQLQSTSARRYSGSSDRDRRKAELSLAIQFQIRATGIHSLAPAVDDWAEWLALMRHYGLPVCLMDWSESVLVAGFFAVWNRSEDDVDGMLWALFPGRLNQLEADLASPFMCNATAPLLENELVDLQAGELGASDKVLAYLPHHRDARQVAQQSAFTIHRSSTPLEARLSGESTLLRFRIPADKKQQVRAGLLTAGIRRTSLFPDLEHLAYELTEDNHFA